MATLSSVGKKLWSDKWSWMVYDTIVPYTFDQSIRRCVDLVKPATARRLVDLGCGNGRILMQLGDWLRNGGRLTGVDMQPSALERARRRADELGLSEHVDWRLSDMCNLASFEADSFDGAVMHFSVYAMWSPANRRRAIAEAARVVRPGGRIACAVPGQDYRAEKLVHHSKPLELRRPDMWIFRRVARRYLSCPLLFYMNQKYLDPLLDRNVFHRYADGELEQDFTAAGLKNIEVAATTGFSAYYAVGEKRGSDNVAGTQ